MFFKVVYNKQVHIYHSKGQTSFESLDKYIREVFKQLPSKYQLTYFDDEDEITLACQSDLETMLQITSKTAKIYIKEVDESFYDQTQKVFLEDEIQIQPLQQQIQKLKVESKEDSSSNLSSEPLLQEVSNKPQVDLEEQVKSVSLSKQFIQHKNNQPDIIEDERSVTKNIRKDFSNQSQILNIMDQSQLSQTSLITEEDIERKFNEMIPEFIEKVKKQILGGEKKLQRQTIIHQRVTCDECGKNNIEGVRYKCAVCADFDLCQTCEVKSNHSHPFLKIKHPKQAPLKIFTIIEDDEQNSLEVNGQKVHLSQNSQNFGDFFNQFCYPEQGKRQGYFDYGFNNFECPYKQRFCNKQEKREEQKIEERSQPQKKAKVQEQKPVENKKCENQKPQLEKKKEEKLKPQIFKKQQTFNHDQIIENSKYIFSIFEGKVSQHKCYEFAKKYPTLSKQDLLNLYLFSGM